jgi:hypothetical protein
MKKILVFAAALLAAGAAALAQDGHINPGLWEVKVLKEVMDGKDMSAEMAAMQERARQAMAAMSPEQRQQMEAMSGGRGIPATGSDGSMRVCISPKMAAREGVVADPQGRCAPSKTSRDGNKVSFEFSCSANGRTTEGKGTATVAADSVQSSVDATMTDSRSRHTLHTESSMKFVGADCQGIKPADELVKGAGQGR